MVVPKLILVFSILQGTVPTPGSDNAQTQMLPDCIAAVELIDQKYVVTTNRFLPVVTVWRYRLLQTIKGQCAYNGAIVELGGKYPIAGTNRYGEMTFSGRLRLKPDERFIVQLIDLRRIGAAYQGVTDHPQMQVINRQNDGMFWITGQGADALALPFSIGLNYGVLTVRIIHLMAAALHPLEVAKQLQSLPVHSSGQRHQG